MTDNTIGHLIMPDKPPVLVPGGDNLLGIVKRAIRKGETIVVPLSPFGQTNDVAWATEIDGNIITVWNPDDAQLVEREP